MKRSTMLLAAGIATTTILGVSAARGASTDPEVAQLRAEVRELRGLVMQVMRVEKEHYDLLMNLAQTGHLGDAALPAPAGVAPDGAKPAPGDAALPHAVARTASVRGRVAFPGGSMQDLYAYVENVKSAPVHGKTVEIAQRKKQFLPAVTVVQRGTKVLFPNYDTFVHNVFSPSLPRPFDLGAPRPGEDPKPVEMASTGVVDVFCNMHSDMHAVVLVVPSPLYTRVAADGSFHLDGVPVGNRKIVIWGPRSKPASQVVDVETAGAEVSLTLDQQPATPHNNKLNQPYPSYDKNQN
jgi:plastocyanin